MLDEHIVSFADLLRDYTSILVLKRYLLEGDDLMAAYVQMNRGDRNIILSGDRDMQQLLRYPGVEIIDPATGKPRTLEDWNGDADIFMFEKCIRGEGKSGDHIQSSYPRLLRKKIFAAFEDEYIKESIMNHTFTQLEEIDGDYVEVVYLTKELFKENEILMDLRKQPDSVKKEMVKTVLEARKNRKRYKHIKFLQYCGQHDLDNIIQRIEAFVPLLAIRPA